MTGAHRFAVACVATALPLLCNAADEVRHDFECDTPSGHFSYWKRSVSGSEIEISGDVTVNDMLKVTVAGSEASTNVGAFKPNSVELSFSTGDFEFNNVVVTEK